MAEGYTRINNKLFDDLARLKASANAFKVLHVIIRQTICFHRNQHDLSNSFLQIATGLNERSVRRAIQELEAKEIIKIVNQNCGSHPKKIRILPDKIGTYQNCPGEVDKSGRDNPDKIGRDNPDKSGREEIKEIENIKEKIKKADSFSSIEEANQYYADHPEELDDGDI